jgi:proteasome lid subunit RPN8/RPN11
LAEIKSPSSPLVSQTLSIHRQHWEQMLEHVTSQIPLEACGLVAGQGGLSREVFQIANVLSSPVRFRMHPEQQIKVLLKLDELGWDLLGIYHSHPNGPPVPSPTDIAESAYPDTVYLIWSRMDGNWTCRGFFIQDGVYREVIINLLPEEKL